MKFYPKLIVFSYFISDSPIFWYYPKFDWLCIIKLLWAALANVRTAKRREDCKKYISNIQQSLTYLRLEMIFLRDFPFAARCLKADFACATYPLSTLA